jgi:hypothetical protein
MVIEAPAEHFQLKARIEDLEHALHQKELTIATAYHLPPNMSNLLGLLLALPVVNTEMICQRLHIATDAKVAIYRLRKELRPYGIDVLSRRGYGYWLDETAKETIRGRLKLEPCGPDNDHLQ